MVGSSIDKSWNLMFFVRKLDISVHNIHRTRLFESLCSFYHSSWFDTKYTHWTVHISDHFVTTEAHGTIPREWETGQQNEIICEKYDTINRNYRKIYYGFFTFFVSCCFSIVMRVWYSIALFICFFGLNTIDDIFVPLCVQIINRKCVA